MSTDSTENLWKVNKIIDDITKLRTEVPMPLLVVYVWDIMRDYLNDDDYRKNVSESEVWKRMWAEADKQGFTLEYGNEALSEHVRDWLIETGAITELEEVEA
jgi:hypothetical protein